MHVLEELRSNVKSRWNEINEIVELLTDKMYTGDRAQRTRLDRILALTGESRGPNGGDQGAAGLVKADISDSGGIAAALSNRNMRSPV